MRLYFFRHGPAGSRMQWDGTDHDRPLTDDGASSVRCMAKHMSHVGLSVDAIVTSPYARACQTADIAAEVLGVEGVEQSEALSPGFGVPELEKTLAAHPNAESLMLVGHEPDFSFVISELCSGARVTMKKSGVARVDLTDHDTRDGKLVWLLPPGAIGCAT